MIITSSRLKAYTYRAPVFSTSKFEAQTLMEQFDRTGIILYTIKYKACVNFYKNVLKLKILFATGELTCFAFGTSYLMIEHDTQDAFPSNGQQKRIRTCLRMNVPDVKALVDDLRFQNIKVDYQEHSWGTIAKFYDPDENLCAFKDSGKFEAQIKAYRDKS